MSEKTLKIDNIEVSKKKFISLNNQLISIQQTQKKIVRSDRFKLSDDGFKYFTSNREDNIIRLLFCVK